MKVLIGLIIISFNTWAVDDIQYRINRFKKSKKISQRTVLNVNSGQMLQQSYDLKGRLRLETEVASSSTRSSCFLGDGTLVSSSDSQKYFICLQSYQNIVKSEDGINEGKAHYSPQEQDLKFSDTGKGLNK